jgi:hypothetical protein
MFSHHPDLRRVDLATTRVEHLCDALFRVEDDPHDPTAWAEFEREAHRLLVFVRVHVHAAARS